MNIEKTKRNIEKWENECKEYLDKGDIGSAVMCRVLANSLREDIGEEKKYGIEE